MWRMLPFLLPAALSCQAPESPITYELYSQARYITSVTGPVITTDGAPALDEIIVPSLNLTKLCKSSLRLQKTIVYFEIKKGLVELLEANFLEAQNISASFKLDHNRISILKRHTFVNLVLETISLHDNQIAVLENSSFVNLPRLTILDLGGNRLREFNVDGVLGVPALQSLNLERNFIEVIRKCAFSLFNNREQDSVHIYLGNNRIGRLEPNAFGCIKALCIHTLNLDSNRLRTVPEGVFDSLRILHIHLRNNSLERPPICVKYRVFNTIEMGPIEGHQALQLSTPGLIWPLTVLIVSGSL